MKRKAFSIVEVLISVFMLGLITLALFPLVVSEMRKTGNSFFITRDGFEAQTRIEQEIRKLYDTTDVESWADDKAELKVSLFGVNDIAVLPKTIKTGGQDIGTQQDYKGSILVLMPKDLALKTNVPAIEVKLKKDSNSKFSGTVSYKINPETSESWKKDIEFCVYRWYIGPNKGAGPSLSDLTVIREYNIAKNSGNPSYFDKFTQLKYQLKGDYEKGYIDYEGISYNIIADGPYAFIAGNAPLVDKGVNSSDPLNGDTFRLDSLNMSLTTNDNDFNQMEMENLFGGGKGLVFSAMPVTKSGEVGKEVFSDMLPIDLDKENLQLAVNLNPVELEPQLYRVKFLLKQVQNLYINQEYFIGFRGMSDGRIYYPQYNNSGQYYYLIETPPTTPKLIAVDNDGYAQFDVLIPSTQVYEMGVILDNNIILAADVSFKP